MEDERASTKSFHGGIAIIPDQGLLGPFRVGPSVPDHQPADVPRLPTFAEDDSFRCQVHFNNPVRTGTKRALLVVILLYYTLFGDF